MWDFPMVLTEGGRKAKRKQFSEEKIIDLLKEHEAGPSVADLYRRYRVSERSICRCKASSAV